MYHHLHVHTEYSALDGLCRVKDYVKLVKERGLQAAAITDHGNMNGAATFIQACEKENIKAIIGSEFYLVNNRTIKEKNDLRYHLILLAKNKVGYKNLCKLTTLANIEGFYKKPRIDWEILKKYSKGVICLSACLQGPVINEVLNGNKSKAIKNLMKLFEIFGEDFYLEIMPIAMSEQVIGNQELIKFSKKYNIPLVATNDVHYLEKKGSEYQEMVLCIQDKKKMSDEKRFKFSINTLYFADPDDMVKMFKKNHPKISLDIILKSLRETHKIVDKCEVYSLKGSNVFPKVDFLKGKFKTTEDKLKNLVNAGMKKYKFDKQQNYKDRLKEEMNLIIDKGFTDYFLLVVDIIEWAGRNNILVGPGRGSSAGSLVCYLLGITYIDPIEYGTLFFRFIDPNRNDLPDIDIDFEDRGRDIVKAYIIERYGQNNVADVGTFSCWKNKVILRDLFRIYDIPIYESNSITKYVNDDITIEKAFESFEELIIFKKKHPKIIEAAINLEGQVKQYGISAAGVIISDKPIVNYTPLELRGAKKSIVTGFDSSNIVDYLGLLKVDILGINFLTIIKDTLSKINKKIDLSKLKPDDKNIFKMLAEGDTIGIFQFETQLMTKISKEISIDNFNDMIVCNSISRPGPLMSGSKDNYINKKHGQIPIHYDHPIYKSITKETNGEIIYQEQIMLIAKELGKMTWNEANAVRKIVAKSKGEEEFLKYEQHFVRGAMENGLNELQAQAFWKNLKYYGSYSFNKSHAVAYSLLGYWCAWLKYYYPDQYFSSFINYSSDDFRVMQGIKKLKDLGYKILPPSIEKPTKKMILIKKGELRIGLDHIKGFGEKVIDDLIKIQKPKNLNAWLGKITKRTVHSGIRKILVNIGYFDCFENKKKLDKFFNIEYKENDFKLKEDWLYEHCALLFCDNILKKYEKFMKKNIHKKIQFDEVHDVDFSEDSNEKGQVVIVKGLVIDVTLKNKNGEDFVVCNFFDGTGYTKVSLYPEVYKKYEKEIWESKNNGPAIIRGSIGPERVYVKDFVNLKFWDSEKEFEKKLMNGEIRNREQIKEMVDHLKDDITNPHTMIVRRIKEHQAKNGLMAFIDFLYKDDININCVVWADAYQNFKNILQKGVKLRVRFSYLKEGKFYLDKKFGRVFND